MLFATKHVIQIGQKFNLLTVADYAGKSGHSHYWWLKCTCGKDVRTTPFALVKGKVKSCGKKGCRDHTHLLKHGESHSARGGHATREYQIWKGMRRRCLDPNEKQFKDYGGRGISFCERWNEFANFLQDMGRSPPQYTLERKDVNGNYEPSNCIWATRLKQNNNKRSNRHVDINGKKMTVADAADLLGLNYFSFWGHLRRGKSVENAISAARRYRPMKSILVHSGFRNR